MSPDVRTRVTATGLVVQGMLTLLALILLLRLWRADLAVPFSYWGDTLLQLAIAKNIADGGWIWFVDRLGAPFGLAVSAFPQNLTTTSIALKLISFFSKQPGLIINVYWLLTVIAASVNAHLSFRMLDHRRSTSIVLATLYALLPYAFYRNVGHLPLVYPFIPVLAAFAVQIAANTAAPLRTRWGKYVTFCAIAQGFDYIYYTFFSVFVFVVAGFVGLLYHRSSVQARRALVVCAVLIASAIVNLTPSIVEWRAHGKPPDTGYKYSGEAEIFGLKLRQMLSPVQPSRFAALRAFGERERGFPNENENTSARLGTVLSLGLLAFVAHCFFRPRLDPQVRAAAALAIAMFLLATVGGLGALFNLLVTPDIRAYNRVVVYIAFFIAVYLAWVFDRWQVHHADDETVDGTSRGAVAARVALAACLVAGVLDQGQAARPIVDRYESDAASLRAEREFVDEIERRYPAGTIMQLPETSFPPDGGRARMLPYDHARPYLTSTGLAWSWPSFSLRREAWYRSLGEAGDAAFLRRLVLSGFSGLWVDRYGYEPWQLATLEVKLTSNLKAPLVGGLAERYAFYDLGPLRAAFLAGSKQSPSMADERYRLLNPLLLSFGQGFYGEEKDERNRHYWSRRESLLRISGGGELPRDAVLHALIQAGNAGTLNVSVAGRALRQIVFAAGESKAVSIPVALTPNAAMDVAFAFDGRPLIVPGDARTMYFTIVNPRLEDH
jgi:phosphoglycerol transferase